MAVYPDFLPTCGYGDVQGICGANCRHSFHPFIPGIMEPTYTKEELAQIDKPPFEYEGKTYSTYAATQKQREIERTIRKLKRERVAFKAGGLTDEEQAVSAKIQTLTQKYNAFSKAAGLRTQRERMNIMVPGAKAAKK